ncbi:ferritin-like domain-containing protein, partial [Streptosporangium sp. NPDC006013]|uniref:ferritin-like domain-containing protein n=1 Tax=Streptosporangium sp. NPDC006013 TaxID=3155596 RepID=UPI0033ADB7AA
MTRKASGDFTSGTTTPHAGVVAAEFLEHTAEEQEHADRLAQRIVQLGGEPDFNPETLTAAAPHRCGAPERGW